jgi:hypothetical protein
MLSFINVIVDGIYSNHGVLKGFYIAPLKSNCIVWCGLLQ